MENNKEYSAHWIVYWPGRPVYACTEHMQKLKQLGVFLGCPIEAAMITEFKECSNCINEAKKNG